MKYLVSTDTSCQINNEMLKKYDISIFPLNVIIDGEEFLDGVSINQDQLKDAMRSGKNIKTSTPPLGLIIEYFEELFKKGYEHIIHFTISSKLSSMFSLFKTVAEQNFPGKITVIDAYSVSIPMLSYVLYAYDQVQAGVEPAEIAKNVEAVKDNFKLVFIPENLTALKNGGRVSPTVAMVGNLLGLKPVLIMKDGGIEKLGTTKRARKELCQVIDASAKDYPIDKYDYAVVNFDADQHLVDTLTEHLSTVFPGYEPIYGFLPINVCSHAGPGTIGLIINPKINGKSIKDFM